MNKKNEVINSKTSDGKDITIVVKNPTIKQLNEAKMVGIRVSNTCIKDGIMPRAKILEYLRESGCWDDKKEAQLKSLNDYIRSGERQLARGGRTDEGISFTKTEARELAIDMRRWRTEQIELLTEQRELDSCSVQGQSENAQFDFLVSVCCYDETDKHIFSSLDDYLEKGTERYSIQSAVALSSMLYGLDEDLEKSRPENKFLVNYGFARDDGRLVDEDKRLIDIEGRLIDEDGRFVNEDGDYVDKTGNLVDEEGSYIVEFTDFPD